MTNITVLELHEKKNELEADLLHYVQEKVIEFQRIAKPVCVRRIEVTIGRFLPTHLDKTSFSFFPYKPIDVQVHLSIEE